MTRKVHINHRMAKSIRKSISKCKNPVSFKCWSTLELNLMTLITNNAVNKKDNVLKIN